MPRLNSLHGPTNVTRQDALNQVLDARVGSLVDPSEKYLEELRRQLLIWIDEVEGKLAALPPAGLEEDWL